MEADNRQFDGKLFLKDVNRKLNDRLAEIQKDLNQGLKEIENMHEYYWENYTEMDQYGYEDYDNQQALLQQVNANRDKSKLMKRLEKMIDSPFFGRVDFLFEAEEEEEPFYIGIGNFGERAGFRKNKMQSSEIRRIKFLSYKAQREAERLRSPFTGSLTCFITTGKI